MPINKTIIVEHLESELYDWCIIEYKHISKIAGRKNVWFTNIKKKDFIKLSKYGNVMKCSVKSLKLNNACILDPEAKKTLTPKIANQLEYFIFGGILGDFPPKKRTKVELSKFLSKVPIFNIGKEQMSTDNAVFTVKKIISGKKIKNLKFQDSVNIKINKILITELPYRYNIVYGKPLISPELIKFIKKSDKL